VYTKTTWFNAWDSGFELRPASAPATANRFGGAVAVHDTLAVVAHTGTNRLSFFRRNATGQWPLIHTITTTPNPITGECWSTDLYSKRRLSRMFILLY
jgi:hypothetical protein